MPTPLITIENVTYAYDGAAVVCGLNLNVDAGSTLGVIGPNGGGKTTLVKLLLGLLAPDSGTIRIAGLPPRQAVARGDLIGYLPQGPTPPGRLPLSVRQLALLGLAGKTGPLRRTPPADVAYVDELLARVGLADLADAPIGTLSGGQLQRALMARALAARPRLVILDEPTTGIDPRGQADFVRLIDRLKRELELTLVLVSHDLRAVTGMSDRIACLNVHLHYHDVPQHVPADLAYELFACDLAAMGVAADAQGQQSCTVHPGAG